MSNKSDGPHAEPEQATNFLSAWEKRKQEVLLEKNAPDEQQQLVTEDKSDANVLLTDDDMPPIETLTDDSDYTGFLSPEVSEPLRKAALRKLFQSAEFNIRDGLDDYDGDYTSFEKLGNIITADLKHQMEVAARKKADEALKQDKAAADALQVDEEAADEDEAAIQLDQIEQDDSVESIEQPAPSDDNKEEKISHNYKKNKQDLDGERNE